MMCSSYVLGRNVSRKHPYSVSQKGGHVNSISCYSCQRWVQKRYSCIQGKLIPNTQFQRAVCNQKIYTNYQEYLTLPYPYLRDMIVEPGSRFDEPIKRVESLEKEVFQLSAYFHKQRYFFETERVHYSTQVKQVHRKRITYTI